MTSVAADHTLRRIARLIVVLNLAYFGIEFAVARVIGSVSLVRGQHRLSRRCVGQPPHYGGAWLDGAQARARVGMALAGILLVPGLATLWTAWEKFNLPVAPDPALLSLTGAGAPALKSIMRPSCWCAT